MELIADGFLIAAALAAAFYCWSINRRLVALKRNGSGLADQFESFGDNIEKARTAIAQSHDLAEAEKARLEALLAEAEEMRKALRHAQTDLLRERARKMDAVETLQKYMRRDGTAGPEAADPA